MREGTDDEEGGGEGRERVGEGGLRERKEAEPYLARDKKLPAARGCREARSGKSASFLRKEKDRVWLISGFYRLQCCIREGF